MDLTAEIKISENVLSLLGALYLTPVIVHLSCVAMYIYSLGTRTSRGLAVIVGTLPLTSLLVKVMFMYTSMGCNISVVVKCVSCYWLVDRA